MKTPPFLLEGQWAIVLTQNNGMPGKLIQWRYGCDVTHCALMTKINGEYLVFDSDIKLFRSGFGGTTWHNWKHKNRVVEHILVPREMVDWNKLVDLLGTRYDFRAWFKHLGIWKNWKKEYNASDAVTCWEAVLYILNLDNWWKGKPTRFEFLKLNT